MQVRVLFISGVVGRLFGCSGGLVVDVGVEDEFAEQFSGGGVDDADLEVLDEQDDAGSGAWVPADADVAAACLSRRRTRWREPALSTRSWQDAGLVVCGVSWSAPGSGFGHRVLVAGRRGWHWRGRDRWGRWRS